MPTALNSRFRAGPAPDETPPRRRAAAAFIYVTIVLDFMAMGVIVPVLPRLIQSLGGGSPGQVAQMFGVFAAVFALLQFLVQPIQGALSDRFGRRPSSWPRTSAWVSTIC